MHWRLFLYRYDRSTIPLLRAVDCGRLPMQLAITMGMTANGSTNNRRGKCRVEILDYRTPSAPPGSGSGGSGSGGGGNAGRKGSSASASASASISAKNRVTRRMLTLSGSLRVEEVAAAAVAMAEGEDTEGKLNDWSYEDALRMEVRTSKDTAQISSLQLRAL